MGFPKVIFIFCFLQFIFVSSTWAKPTPPPKLLDILKINSEFEESYEKGNWREARKALVEITEGMAEHLEYAERYKSEIKLSDFNPILVKISAAVAKEDIEEVEKLYLFYQKNLFVFMDQFEYEYHPILLTIDKYIADEAREEAEKGNYSEVESELKEVLVLISKALVIIRDAGVPETEIKSFSSQLRKTIKDCKVNTNNVKDGVIKLEKTFKGFLEKAHN